jgi:hypothetical protein
MRLKHNLLFTLAVIASRATDLEKACQALPDTEAAMAEALESMGQQERTQAAEYVRLLSQKCYVIRQECLWIVQRLQAEGQP